MSDYTPEVGHRFRVSRDAIAFAVTPDTVMDTEGRVYARASASFERLPDPEPEWQPGDVVTDNVGDTCAYIPDSEWSDPWLLLHRGDSRALVSTPGIRFPDDDMERPLTPLLRNGKPWAEATGGAA